MEGHVRPVNSCLDQVRQIVSQGAEYLSTEEITTLERKGDELKSRFDRTADKTDKLQRKISAALDELQKFRTEITTFKTWLAKSVKLVEDKERLLANLSKIQANSDVTREFVSDVIAHQADLRFITMAAQKFIDESVEYLAVLNEFRALFSQPMAPIQPADVAVTAEVTEVTASYQVIHVWTDFCQHVQFTGTEFSTKSVFFYSCLAINEARQPVI